MGANASTERDAGSDIFALHRAPTGELHLIDCRVPASSALGWVGRAKDDGRPAMTEAAAAKLFVSEAYLHNALDAMRVHGGLGNLTETGIEADVRNAIGAMFYFGTADIQRNIIARTLKL